MGFTDATALRFFYLKSKQSSPLFLDTCHAIVFCLHAWSANSTALQACAGEAQKPSPDYNPCCQRPKPAVLLALAALCSTSAAAVYSILSAVVTCTCSFMMESDCTAGAALCCAGFRMTCKANRLQPLLMGTSYCLVSLYLWMSIAASEPTHA